MPSFGDTIRNATRRLAANPSIALSLIAIAISLSAVLYQVQQNLLVRTQNEIAVHGMLIERNARLLELLLENPETRPFFYDNRPLPTNDPILEGKVLTLAEMWTDFFEQVMIQSDNLPEDMAPTWKSYARDMHSSSTAIQAYFAENCAWYHPELRRSWGCRES